MKTWADLIKVQPLASKIMMNSFKRNRVSHAYLIQGMRGTGKKSLATLIAMTHFCTQKEAVEPCQTCHMCKRIMTGNHPDVHWIIPEGKTIKTEQIEALQTEFSYSGMESEKKVYIITAAESLTINAANRMLKFLEEPEVETIALLLTNNGQAIVPTIKSRCQILDLQPLDMVAFQNRLVQLGEISISENNARLLSALTNNIDEAIDYHQEEKIYQIRDLVEQFINVLLMNYEERYLFVHQRWLVLLKDRNEQELGLDLLLIAFKDMINYQNDREREMFLFHADDRLMQKGASQFTQKRLLNMLKSILDGKKKLQQNVHPTLLMEQLVLQL